MRRIVALVTLLVLSLSRSGAPAPEHASSRSVHRASREMVASAPSVRLVSVVARELASRAPVRAPTPWHPSRSWDAIELGVLLDRSPIELPGGKRLALGAWCRFTYDATAPPRLS
jgi:hypothetical protein